MPSKEKPWFWRPIRAKTLGSFVLSQHRCWDLPPGHLTPKAMAVLGEFCSTQRGDVGSRAPGRLAQSGLKRRGGKGWNMLECLDFLLTHEDQEWCYPFEDFIHLHRTWSNMSQPWSFPAMGWSLDIWRWVTLVIERSNSSLSRSRMVRMIKKQWLLAS